MKQLIIILLLVIAGIIGYGKYNQYKRYNSESIAYKTDKKLDFEYHNQDLVLDYHSAVADLNNFVTLQWTANHIDVRTPENDDDETQNAVRIYAKKLGVIAYYETKLETSATLKLQGANNQEIKFLEEKGTSLKAHKENIEKNKIKSLFDASKRMKYGEKSPLIYEVQKRLVANGLDIKIDGIFKIETLNAIKSFEEENKLFADGYLDVLTLDALFQ